MNNLPSRCFSTKVCEAIDRLKELRTALISAAVTGKIDVRAALDRSSPSPKRV
jgi:hypothetical protein